MKPKTRHIDGGGRNPLVHKEMNGQMNGKNKNCQQLRAQTRHTNPKPQAKVKGNAYEIKNTTRWCLRQLFECSFEIRGKSDQQNKVDSTKTYKFKSISQSTGKRL